MSRQSLIALAGGGFLVALLLVAALVISGGNGALATKSQDTQISTAVGGLPGAGAAPTVSTSEADAWAEARAADTSAAYRTYLAAFPTGAFAADANQAIGRVEALEQAKAQPKATRVVEHTGVGQSPVQSVASRCHAYVNQILPPPSKKTRAVGGAAAGCAVGVLAAGGNDARNCAIGAVAGGATGYVTADARERRRTREYEACVARGGPGR